jgi:uncharacterized RDD family membrane protein YckC
MPDDSWYYAQDNQQLGPVTLEALRGMVASGQVGAADLVWTQGMAQWQPARSVPEVGNVLLAGVPGAGGAAGGTAYGAPTGYSPGPGGAGVPGGGAGQLGYGVGQTYYQQQYGHHPVYAGFWLRFCAFFIDYIILFVPFFILGMVIELAVPSTVNPRTGMQTPTPVGAALSLGVNLVSIVVSWLYYALQESGTHQATFGKRAVGLRVTDLDGQPIGFGQATGRYFAKILSGCILAIGYIMAAFTEKKQALHDMIASTLVVKK